MKQISILVPEGENNLSSIVGAFKIFSRANQYWEEKTGKVKFKIVLAGLTKSVDFHGGLFAVKPNCHISKIIETNLVVIPSLNHAYNTSIGMNGELVAWLIKMYQKGAELASICTGAYLLAETGLLDGRSCSTHWLAANDFNARFPKVKLEEGKLITDENGIYTNGGAFSFLNLILYLVEKKFDRETAIYCSKVFQIEIDRTNQSEFIIFRGQKNHDDEAIIRAQKYIERNVPERISVARLSDSLALGRRNFDRRFIKATGNTPLEYIQRVKVEVAKQELERTNKTVNEVMFAVGYNDAKAFREVFRKIAGMSPMEYKDKYNPVSFSR